MDNEKKPKIVFMPGCFDNLDIDQDELDSLMAEIQAKIEDGSIFEESRKLDPNDPEDAEILADIELNMNTPRNLQ